MRAIRNMESAWEKVSLRKFAQSSRKVMQPNGGVREFPCYELTKTETLYIATKFRDEDRAKLVLRWEELERERLEQGCLQFTIEDAKRVRQQQGLNSANAAKMVRNWKSRKYVTQISVLVKLDSPSTLRWESLQRNA